MSVPSSLLTSAATAEQALTWLTNMLVYLVHALFWASLAASLSRWARERAATQRGLWLLAFFGPLLTVALSHVDPRLDPWSTRSSVLVVRLAGSAVGEHTAGLAPTTLPSSSAAEPAGWLSWTLERGVESALLSALLLAACVVGLARLGSSLRLLCMTLRDRRPVGDSGLLARFELLRVRAGLPAAILTESHGVACPLAIGRREVCFPVGLLSDFSDAELDAVLAHELAHLAHGDGVWFPIVGLLESLLWMQPLNRWVADRFRKSAELAADDRAVELTRAPRALALALVRLAETTVPATGRSPLPGMASSPSMALLRVKRLMHADARDLPAVSPGAETRATRGWLTLYLAALGLLVSSVGAHVHQPGRSRDERPASGREPRSAPADEGEQRARAEASRYQADMEVLALRARELELSIARHSESRTLANSPELLDLEQSLRHVRATQAWTEQRFISSSAGPQDAAVFDDSRRRHR